ncbi:sugar ABC transporter ATP-binding protein [Asaia bogorensis]|uniref:D-xylose transport ATP-binding protein XylG n=3 Tax=Asaia TaxID=91914 RepID=A0A060QK44_9PROT|nr:sugar ABC transporter ATP-binding protein [Asaia bogorensis]CDG41143.1 D-xylose transport ATP-binding protein XylG [Asaia bogorensis]
MTEIHSSSALPLLKLQGITKSFPGVKALKGVSLDLMRGEIHALLGENGAGKSTIIKIIGGIQRQDEGEMLLDGEACHFTSYRDAIARGIGIVFQEFSLVPDLDAIDNIFLGRERRNALGLSRRTAMARQAAGLFERIGVQIDLTVPVGRLSVAEQQFVEIAKALSLDVRILILDEPTAPLTPNEAALLFRVMRQLRDEGIGIIFVSHHLEEIFEICDRITILRDGANVGLTPVASCSMDHLVEMMVGRRIENSFPPKADDIDRTVLLTARHLRSRSDAVTSDFDLHAGEILGFAGLVGSGRTETALALIGALPCPGKSVTMRGRDVTLSDPAAALKAGIGLLPENRKIEGLILPFSIRDNISINNLPQYTRSIGLIDRRKEREKTASLMRALQVKAPDAETATVTLSGGNQQKVVIARWLNRRCPILIFDEPTRGIDVGAKAEIYRLMRDLTGEGFAIIMISSELPEIVGMCDRVAVFYRGAISTILEGDALNAEEIMRHATSSGTKSVGQGYAPHQPAGPGASLHA